ncbi:MAG: protease inhibitor Inh/omp19 family protein [Rhizobiaceae bacterium]
MRANSGSWTMVVLAGLLVSGCQSDRISGIDSGPAPVAAAPAGTVTAAPLPSPAAPKPVVTDPSAFPTAPTAPVDATAPAAAAEVASAAGPDVTVGSVAGVWNVSLAGQSCKVATPQTKFGQGFRAGPLKCPAEMANVKSWNVAGKQLVMYDEGGATIARLYSTGSGFSGQTAGGAPITFSR